MSWTSIRSSSLTLVCQHPTLTTTAATYKNTEEFSRGTSLSVAPTHSRTRQPAGGMTLSHWRIFFSTSIQATCNSWTLTRWLHPRSSSLRPRSNRHLSRCAKVSLSSSSTLLPRSTLSSFRRLQTTKVYKHIWSIFYQPNRSLCQRYSTGQFSYPIL